MTTQDSISRTAASYRGSVSQATKASLLSRGLDVDAHGLTVKDAKSLLSDEQERQASVRHERRERRTFVDVLKTPAAAALERARITLGRDERLNNWQHRHTVESQDKDKVYHVPAPGQPFGVLLIEGKEDGYQDYEYARRTKWSRFVVEDRYVALYRVNPFTGQKQELARTDEYVSDGFRGDWLLNSAARLLGRPYSKLPNGVSVRPNWQSERGVSLRRVQLNEHCRVQRLRVIGHVRTYHRTLAGVTVDYCAVTTNERGTVQDTYHAATEAEAVSGLRDKIKKQERKASAEAQGIVTVKLARSLGFCEAGIRSFIDAFDLHGTDWIGVDDLAALVRKAPHKATPFAGELRTIAAHFDRHDLINEAREYA